MKSSSQDIHLRLLEASDEPLYLDLYGDPETMRHIGPALDRDRAGRSFRAACRANQRQPPNARFWVVQARGTGQSLGLIGLHWDGEDSAELGVVLPPALQGRGVATAAITCLLPLAFDALRLARIHTRHAQAHGPASGLMTAVGFSAVASSPTHPGRYWELAASQWRLRQVPAGKAVPRRVG